MASERDESVAGGGRRGGGTITKFTQVGTLADC